MNKKQLIVAAMATVLSVSAANATTDITGVTGNSGVYDIYAAKVNGDVGYRFYDNFKLDEGNIANLIFRAQNGDKRALETFINLVGGSDKINIQGIVNTVRDGEFHNGHAIFISPNGLVVGASGVLNVGTLSVITPTSKKFTSLKDDYDNANYSVINNISTLRNGDGMNEGGNAPVDIQGKILTRGTGNNGSGVGLDIRGSQVDISGTVVNGYNGTNTFSTNNGSNSANDAAYLFSQLVNTNGTIKAASTMIADDAGRVVIKSGADVSPATSGINIKDGGHVVNLGTAETAITNHGSNGLQVAGTVATNGKLNVFNNNLKSDLTVSGNLTNKNAALSVTNKGVDLKVTSTANLVSDKNIEVVNNGKGTKAGENEEALYSSLLFDGTALTNGKIDIVNRGAGGMNIQGTVGKTSTAPTNVRIVNENGQLVFSGNAYATEDVSIRNQENGTGGMTLAEDSVVEAGKGVMIYNKAGDATLAGQVKLTDGKAGDIHIYNTGDGKLTLASTSSINGNGNIAIKNTGANGMELAGSIVNKNAVVNDKKGETAINNLAGAMTVNGSITTAGNTGINNEGKGAMTVDAKINNTGDMTIANFNGSSFTVNNTAKTYDSDGNVIDNGNVITNAGKLKVYNYNGDFEINGDISNKDGYLYVLSRGTSAGLTTGEQSSISNSNGDLAIKHNGTGTNTMDSGTDTNVMGRGLDLKGSITKSGTNGELAINNYKGDMYVGGTITTNATTGIINRTGGSGMTVNATVESTGNNELNIKNEAGTGNITVNGNITHDGRLNVLANEGTLTLGGTVTNNGTDRTYAVAKNDADEINVTSAFNATSTDGMIYILNKVGSNGMTYAGKATSTNGQVEIYNKAGNMTVTGSLSGNPTVILNKGGKLTVTDSATVGGSNIKIVNQGTESAEVASKYTKYFREQLNK